MPWKIKRLFLLILLGVGALSIGSIVVATAHDWDIRLLGIVCIIGGLAMVLVALPGNGNGSSS
jgi:cytochrome c biogenesis protein CcdA